MKFQTKSLLASKYSGIQFYEYLLDDEEIHEKN
jgi:hypothetical protein